MVKGEGEGGKGGGGGGVQRPISSLVFTTLTSVPSMTSMLGPGNCPFTVMTLRMYPPAVMTSSAGT